MKNTIRRIVIAAVSLSMVFVMAVPTFADTAEENLPQDQSLEQAVSEDATDESQAEEPNTEDKASSEQTQAKPGVSAQQVKAQSTVDISRVTISGLASKLYNGSAVKQNLKLTYNGATLKEGTDYTLSYKNNVKVGKAYVIITGKGEFSNKITKPFKIYIPSGKFVQKGKSFYVYIKGKPRTAGWVKAGGNLYYATNNGKLYNNRIVTINKHKYYFGKRGAVVRGVFTVGKSRYYGAVKGEPWGQITKAKFITYKGKRYLASNSGAFYKPGFFKHKAYYYYAQSDCSIARKPFDYAGYRVTPNSVSGAITQNVYNHAMQAAKNYIVVDISDQTLLYYKNGKIVLRSRVVTGKNSSPTPRGTFRILSKQRGVTLRGLNDDGSKYASYVSYWMPFIGNSYGLHDASWRGSFGGRIYVYSGSHGCVNMPSSNAARLYSMVPVGTRVVIKP